MPNHGYMSEAGASIADERLGVSFTSSRDLVSFDSNELMVLISAERRSEDTRREDGITGFHLWTVLWSTP